MFWPSPLDYNEALQNPRLAFADEELREGGVALNSLGLPLVMSGACASVYRITCAGKPWAVRCFFQNRGDQHDRYRAVSQFVCFDDLECTVHFQYLEQGIKVRGDWFPILKMEWVDGQTLDQFLAKNNDREVLKELSDSFREMMHSMQAAGIAHGDLQHGNVMIIEGNRLRLVDYDCMFVPKLSGKTSLEIGHRNYQHPRRTGHHFGPYLDNFSAWLMYLSLKCLSIDPALMRVANGGDECILFRHSDLLQIEESPIFRAMVNHGHLEVRQAAYVLRKLLSCSVEIVPGLSATFEEIDSLPESEPNLFDIPDMSEWIHSQHTTGGASSRSARSELPRFAGAKIKRSIDDACHHAWLFFCSAVSPSLLAEQLLRDAEEDLSTDCPRARSRLNDALDLFIKSRIENNSLKARLYLILGHAFLIERQFDRAHRAYSQVKRLIPRPQMSVRLPHIFNDGEPYYEAILATVLMHVMGGNKSSAARFLAENYDSGRLLSALEFIQMRPLPDVAIIDTLLYEYADSLFEKAHESTSESPPELMEVASICEAILYSVLRKAKPAVCSADAATTTLLLGLAAFRRRAYSKAERCFDQVLETTLEPGIRKRALLPLALVYKQREDEAAAQQMLRGLSASDVRELTGTEIGRVLIGHHEELGDLLREYAMDMPKARCTEWYQAAISVYEKVKDRKPLELADCLAACGEVARADKIVNRFAASNADWRKLRPENMINYARASINDCILRGKLLEASRLIVRYKMTVGDDEENIELIGSKIRECIERGDTIAAMNLYCLSGLYNESDKASYARLLEDAFAAQTHDNYKSLVALFESIEGVQSEDTSWWKRGVIHQLLAQDKREAVLDIINSLKLTIEGIDSQKLLHEELTSLRSKMTAEELFAVARRNAASSFEDPAALVCRVLMEGNDVVQTIQFASRHGVNVWQDVESKLKRSLVEAIQYEDRLDWRVAGGGWEATSELQFALAAIGEIIKRPDRRTRLAKNLLPEVQELFSRARTNWPSTAPAKKSMDRLVSFMMHAEGPQSDEAEVKRLVSKSCQAGVWDGYTFKLAHQIMRRMAETEDLSPMFCSVIAETIRRSDVVEADGSIWQFDADLALLIEVFEDVASNDDATGTLYRLRSWTKQKLAQQKESSPEEREDFSSFEERER